LILSTWNAVRDKVHRRSWRVCATLLWSGLLCLIIAKTRETIDSNGVLHEAGALLPMGWGVLILGFLGVFFRIILNLYGKICDLRT